MSERDNDNLGAMDQFRGALSGDRILSDGQAQARYGCNTLAVERVIAGAVRPESTEQVASVVEIARDAAIPLYPVSTGRNWGYGSATPVRDNCVVLDLGDLKGIDDSEIGLGLITVEPGVTQRDLRDFLDRKGYGYLVPVHGGGPDCSLVGNAIERGYGITPHADHFGAVMAVEAVLPDGRLYRPALTELGVPTVDHAFKWGVGPYLDGLFTQGNFGIVVRMTIALAPIPERVDTFMFGVGSHEELRHAVTAVQQVLNRLGGISGSINLMNTRRILSMSVPYPEEVAADEVMPDELVRHLAKQNQVLPWTGVGALYGDKALVRAARRIIRKQLRGVGKRLLFLDPWLLRTGRLGAKVLPRGLKDRLINSLDTLDKTLALIGGAPSEIALPLAYWRSGFQPPSGLGARLDPDSDGSGLIWYSPLVPMEPERTMRYVEMVDEVCRKYGIEPLITLTSLSPRCFDSTIPLLFDPTDPEETQRAHDCFDELLRLGIEESGVAPYRYPIHYMNRIFSERQACWDLVTRIEGALDPSHIIAPGRYGR